MSTNDENNSKPEPRAVKPKVARKPKKTSRANKAGKVKADRTNKKAEITAAHPRRADHPSK